MGNHIHLSNTPVTISLDLPEPLYRELHEQAQTNHQPVDVWAIRLLMKQALEAGSVGGDFSDQSRQTTSPAMPEENSSEWPFMLITVLGIISIALLTFFGVIL